MRNIFKLLIILFLFNILNNVDGFRSKKCVKKSRIKKLSKGDTNYGFGLNYTPYKYDSVIIFLHGLCCSAMGLEQVAFTAINRDILPRTKWILPTAKYRKITALNGTKCPAWFDIQSFSVYNYIEDEVGLLESAERIQKIIRKEIKSGIDERRIFLAGFSQGATTALLTALTIKNVTLGGVLLASGWIPLNNHFTLGKNSYLNNDIFDFHVDDMKRNNTKVLMYYGSLDDMIPQSIFSYTILFLNGRLKLNNIVQRVYVNMFHEFSTSQQAHFLTELSKLLTPTNIHDDLNLVEQYTTKNRRYAIVIKATDENNNDVFLPFNNKDQIYYTHIKDLASSRLIYHNKEEFDDLIELLPNTTERIILEAQYFGDVKLNSVNMDLYIQDIHNLTQLNITN